MTFNAIGKDSKIGTKLVLCQTDDIEKMDLFGLGSCVRTRHFFYKGRK